MRRVALNCLQRMHLQAGTSYLSCVRQNR